MVCSSQIDVHLVQKLLDALNAGEQETATRLLDELTKLRESELYQKVSGLTQNLHETLDQLVDNRLLLQTKHDLPDMTERLESVIGMTEEASSKTLQSSERGLNLIESIENMLSDLKVDEVKIEAVKGLLANLSTELTNIMLAQSFQDLTGQVLNRVMLTTSLLEQSLIQLIAESGHDYDAIPDKELSEDAQKQEEMKGIGPNVTQKSKQDSVDSQSDVDDLLGELGI